jgi:type VI secretion system protein ImpH
MAGAPGIETAALATLGEDAGRYSLFAMLRALEQAFAQQPRLGETRRAQDDPVRVQQPPFMAFAPTDVRSLDSSGLRPVLEQFSFGLFGPNGGLPLHLTEYAFERRFQFSDPTLSDFVNLFQHRMTTLFYRAWANSDPATSFDRPEEDRFRTYLGALMGLGDPASWKRDAVPDAAKFSRIAQMGPRSRSAWGLESALASYFGRSISVRQFVGSWLPIPESDRCRLGDGSGAASLGVGASIGAATWQCQHQFEVIIGPLRMEEFVDFLPGTPALRALHDIVRLYTNGEWAWQARLLLRSGDVPGARLDSTSRLGWSTWLGGRQKTANDVVLRGSSGT